jgi:hypothetical protein
VTPDGRPAIGQPLSNSHDLENAIVAFSKYKLTVLTIKQLMDVGMHTAAHGWDHGVGRMVPCTVLFISLLKRLGRKEGSDA